MKANFYSFSKALFIIVLMIGMLTVDFVSAQNWYDSDWQYRRNISVTNPGGSDLVNHQVMISLDNSSFDFTNALSDGSDIIVTSSDKISIIPFWIETWDATGELATIWVKVPNIPIAGTSVYVYYGNPTPNTLPNPIEGPPVGPFTKSPINPIVPLGDSGNGAGLLAENIVYDDVSGHYWMVFAIYRGTASTGLAWSDDPTDPDSWNWHGSVIPSSNAPHIMEYDGTWYIFYADRAHGGPPYPISVATSATVNGTYTYQGIVLEQNPDPLKTWDDYRVDEPYVFQRNDGKWIMIYMGDAGSTVEQVGFAEADNITGPYTKFADNPCIAFGPPGSFDAGTIADPWVVEFDGTYYIGYTVSPTISSPWQTALATTTDWVTFTKKGILLPLAGEFNSFRGAVTRIDDEYVFSYTTKITSSGPYQMGIATQPVMMDPSDFINNPEAVFDFYDGFDGTSINLTKWTFEDGTIGQTNVSGGLLTITAGTQYVRLLGPSSFGMDYINETYGYHPDQGTANLIAETGFADAAWNTARIVDDFPSTTHWQREAKTSGSPQSLIDMAVTADDNWHTFRVYRESPNIAGFQIDNSTIETSTTDVPTMALSPLLMSYGNGNEFVLDWTRVRKFASTDPSISIGGEQIQLPPIIITYTKTDVTTCYGAAEGAIDISVTGGSESYTYFWSPGGEETEDISGLAAGTYFVVVTDDADNTAISDNIEITQPDELLLNYTITNPIICSTCTATILISATGGTAPYTGTGSFEQAVGTVIYTVTDDNGCSSDISVTINEPAPWYDDEWQHRREVAISNTVGIELTEYQVLITLDNSFYFGNANTDGSDIRVTLDDGTTSIPFWIENWDATGEEASIWVRIPTIPIEGTTIYLYYGNPAPIDPTGDPIETPPIGPFTKSLDNPIIPAGDPGSGQGLLAENIVYDDVSGHYWMVFAIYRSGSYGVGLVWSDTPNDPTSWNWHGNVYNHGGSGSFAPHIIKEGGLWYIFFAQFPNIVYMTSSTIDGTYSSPTVVLTNGAAGTWEDLRADEPYVFQRNDGKWIMVYMGDSGGNVEQVGYAEADAITGPYTKYPLNPCLAFGPPGTYDAGTIADPWCVEFDGTYYIGYTVSPTTSSPWQTALATTTDWQTFTKHGVLLPLGSEYYSFRGAVTRIDDEYVFSYAGGASAGAYRMSIATQPVFMAPMSTINNAEAVFDFYDEFDGTSLDASKWTFSSGIASQASVGSGALILTHTGGAFPSLISNSTFGMDYIFETYAQHPQQGTLNMVIELGFNQSFGDVVRIVDDFPESLPSPTTNWNRQSKLESQSGDPGWQPMAQSADQDWHVFHIGRQGSNTAGFQIDDYPMETVTTGVPITELPVFLMSYTQSATNQLIVDWTRVRKWAGPDPISEVGTEQTNSALIDIAIFNTTCGDFEVRVKPNTDIVDNYLTNIQFTIKWPENTVDLTAISSSVGVSLQSSVVDNGMHYAVFVSVANPLLNWDANTEYTVLSFSQDQSTTGYADFEIDTLAWAGSNNGDYYVELLGLDYTGIVYGNASNVYLGKCGEIKAFLQTPYKGNGLMNKGLAGNIPLEQPYDVAPWDYMGTESLMLVDTSAIDWVLVELRSDSITTVEKKAALLLEDGSIVQYNNTSQGVHFDNTVEGSSYYIVVHHRNHMPVMTRVLKAFDGTLVDFTDETICYGTPNAEIELETNIYGMIAGDINTNGYLSYSGPDNDRGLILARIVSELNTTNVNDTTIGYFDEDVMMDYQVKYIGANNDRSILLTNLSTLTGTVYLNAFYQTEVPGVTTKSEIINDGPIHIFLAETENELQVKIMSDEIIENGIVDNVQFTLSWEVDANEIIAPVLENAQSTFGLIPQGEAAFYEGKMYQVFVSVALNELPAPFDKKKEVVLVSFTKDKPATVGSSIGIADNAYTSNHNADYYISLLGTNYTGTIKTASLGLAELENTGLSIYPNPVASGIIHMEMNLDKSQEVTISVMNIQGKIVNIQRLKIDGGFTFNQIDIQNLTKGIYYIKVQADNLNSIKKIIKM